MPSLEDRVFNPVLLLDQVLAGHHLGRHCHCLPPSAPPSLQPDAKYQIDRDLLKRKRKEKKKSCYLFTQGHLLLILSGQVEPHYSLIWLFSLFIFHTLWKSETGGLTFP